MYSIHIGVTKNLDMLLDYLHKCCVIKNALPDTEWIERPKFKKGDPIKLIHTSTPWRGLNVLLGAMELIKRDDITLDVYSSTKIYGSEFELQNDKQFKPMYDKMDSLQNVNHIGYKPNNEIIQAIKDTDFCISINMGRNLLYICNRSNGSR